MNLNPIIICGRQSGRGELNGMKHQMTAALQWRMDEKTRLDSAFIGQERRETNSSEQVIANRSIRTGGKIMIRSQILMKRLLKTKI